MPHAILKGSCSLDKCLKPLQALEEISESWRIKIQERYLELNGLCALLHVIVVEEGHSQTFYIKLSQSNENLSVRLDSETDPIKTRGVKRSIAFVAENLLESEQNLYLDHHNLKGYFTFGKGLNTENPAH